jgi:hypothetical protein
MKKNSLFLIGISIGILCYACTSGANENKEENSPPYGPPSFSKSYIQGFMGYDKLKAHVRVGDFKIDEDTKTIDHGYIGIDPDGRYSSLSDGIRLLVEIEGPGFNDCARFGGEYVSDLCLEHTQKFHVQVEEIGDTLFNKTVYIFGDMAQSTLAQIKSVTITGDKDFSASYPAGSSLNNLFTVYFNDPYALIKNNYQPIEGTYKYHTDSYTSNYPFAVFKENLSAVNFSERPFIDYRWHMVLNVAPEITDTYTFHIVVTLADDTVLETSASLGIQGTNNAS